MGDALMWISDKINNGSHAMCLCVCSMRCLCVRVRVFVSVCALFS